MKAILYNKRSRPDRLIYCDIEKPVPSNNEVLVKVHAVSLNAADYRSMQFGIIPARKIFGADISGRVESVGRDVTAFSPGDEVIGDLSDYGFGGLAEYVAAPEQALVAKPSSLSFEEGAALPLAALTALQALRDKGNIQTGQKVLIVGCAGGVGTYAIQLARYFGAHVTGVCSTKNVSQSITLGADNVFDYTGGSFLKKGEKYDIIIGINGNYPLTAYYKSLSPNGVFVMVGGSLLQILRSFLFGWLLSFGSRKMKTLAAKYNKSDLEFLAGLAEKGIIRPVIERFYMLNMTADAMKYMKQGHSRGKVIVKVIQ
jgi:NADPH:quinone reductase-like Zn-dependent oxidoreductase